jgi:hypothetical protein
VNVYVREPHIVMLMERLNSKIQATADGGCERSTVHLLLLWSMMKVQLKQERRIMIKITLHQAVIMLPVRKRQYDRPYG